MNTFSDKWHPEGKPKIPDFVTFTWDSFHK